MATNISNIPIDKNFIKSRPYVDANGVPFAGVALIQHPWLGRIYTVWKSSFDVAAKEGLESFTKLQSIDDETKSRIASQVKTSILLINAWQAWWDVVNLVTIVWTWNFQFSRALSLLLPLLVFRLHDGIGGLLIAMVLSFSIFYSSSYLLSFAESILSFLQKSGSEWFVLALSCLVLFFGYQEIRELHIFPALTHGLQAGVIAVLVYYSVALVVMLLWKGLTKFVEVAKRSRYPREEIIQTLCSVLSDVEGVSDHLTASDRAFYLEWTASVVEHDLARKFRTFDAGTDAWLQKALKRRAARLRELKRSILMPGATSYTEVTQTLANVISCAADERWRNMQENLDDIQQPAQRMQLVFQILRPVALLLFFAAVVAYVAYGKNPTFEPLKGNIIPGAITGLILLIASLIDPVHSKIFNISSSPSGTKA